MALGLEELGAVMRRASLSSCGVAAWVLSVAACSVATSGANEPATGETAGGATSLSSEASAPSPTGPTEGDPAKAMVDAHNRYRAAHCAPPLEWSSDLAKAAQGWANHLAHAGCKLSHSTTSLGENLAAGTAGSIPPERAVELWYGESKGYDYGKSMFTPGAGHFTQVVWKGSRHVGCGMSSCADKQIWVCNYDPAGNVQGDFVANVGRPSCKK